jgi:hypothetical protein
MPSLTTAAQKLETDLIDAFRLIAGQPRIGR